MICEANIVETACSSVFLQRHGESETNVSGCFTCRRLEPGLTANGKEAISRKAEYYRQAGIRRIVSSPSRRTLETAGILSESLGLLVETDDDLLEVHIGSLEGKSEHDPELLDFFLNRMQNILDGSDEGFPGGESGIELRERVKRLSLRYILTESQNTLLIGHAAIFAILMGIASEQKHPIAKLFLPRSGSARFCLIKREWEVFG
ncbi:MAG: histidine phosphatase family protein [Victivallales bacterium]|jgi:broad specificity phosphatase PhoE